MTGMITVIVPLALLLFVVLCKPIPKIGGSVKAGLLIGAGSALLISGVFNPIEWGNALITGLSKLAWVIALAIVGSIYAESQARIGTMETVLEASRAKFGKTPKGLVFVVLFVLMLSGSLLGDSIASAVVIGVLVIRNLDEISMTAEQICATIVMGCCLGSIMPPISQASAMAAGMVGLSGAEADTVLNWTYLTVGLSFIAVCIYATTLFVKVKQIPQELIPDKKASQILKENWKSLIPLTIFALLIIFRSGFHLDILVLLKPLFEPWSKIPIISGFGYKICQLLYIVLLISLFYKPVRQNFGSICWKGIKNVKASVSVQLCAACLVGAFYVGGQVEAVTSFSSTLSANTLIFGGLVAMCLIGMITGSQTSTQSIIFTFFGPALVAVGVPAVNAAIVGGHWAMAGQGMPPADVVTFVVAGLITSVIGKEVNLMKSMKYSFFQCACFIIVGLIFAFV